jgi:EmrB/QacA subfamily drug resistance transporter
MSDATRTRPAVDLRIDGDVRPDPDGFGAATTPHLPRDPRRFRTLAIVVVAQLMLVLDATVVIIALPAAQRELHISVADREWMVTAYTLAFGGLLLLGGRMADRLGRKRMFVLSLLGFAAASALGGLAQDAWMLFGARAVQGAMAAVMAPAALSLLTVTFTDERERARAFAIYGAVAGGGSAIGMILGGLLTEYTSWRWTLLVNAPVAVVAALAASSQIRESRVLARTHYDVAGAVTATVALLAVVYGFTHVQTDGWGAPVSVAALTAGVALLGAFVVIERRSDHPLLPLRVVADRDRGGALLVMGLAGMAMFGAFLFLTYYLQGTLHETPLATGVAFLPVTVGVVAAAAGTGRLLPRTGPRPLLATGLAVATVGFVWATRIGVHTDFVTHLLPAEVLMGFGLGMAMTTASSTALVGVDDRDAGVASAVLNASEQVGLSIGVAVLNTVAASATAGYLAVHGRSPAATAVGVVHGYRVGFLVGAGVLVVALLVTRLLVRPHRHRTTTPSPGAAPDR